MVTDGDVTAALIDIPDLGAEGDVLIQLTADPCIEVPERRVAGLADAATTPAPTC